MIGPMTTLHKVSEIADDQLVEGMLAAPLLVIAPSLLEIFTRNDVQRSILAIIEVGFAQLPYPQCVIEFSVTNKAKWFVLLSEIGGGQISAQTVSFHNSCLVDVSPIVSRVSLSIDGLVLDKSANEAAARAILLATSFALLMLNTKGIEKEFIEPKALNKAREESGKPPVPAHSYVKIGVVYDRSNAANSARGKMPVHLRSAHVRNQACGEAYQDRKLIFVPAVLVNFAPEDHIPVPRRKVSA